MTRCIQVFERQGRYLRIPDTEVEDWEEVREGLDQQPRLLGSVSHWPPFTHAFRLLPDNTIYLVELVEESQ
jgi:hypothetical protein